MKKILPLLILLLTVSSASAQLFKGRDKTLDKAEYQVGAVPEVNGKVVFEESFAAKGDSKEIAAKAQEWVKKRFAGSNVIKHNIYENEKPGTLTLKSEEYITFKKKTFVLDRTRITYFLDISDMSCTHFAYENFMGWLEHFSYYPYNAHCCVIACRCHKNIILFRKHFCKIKFCTCFSIASGDTNNSKIMFS